MSEHRFSTHKPEDLAGFKAAADELMSSKYILAEKRISDLLKTIATNSELLDLFRTALSGYNYSVEFNKSRTSSKGKPKLVLPKNQARKIAYIFCLLMEFDTGKRSLKDFLDTYYYMPQPNASLALWTKDMITVFKDVTEYLYVNGIETLLDNEEIDYSLRRQVGEILENMNALLVRSSSVGADTKRDLFVILSAVENSLTPNKADVLKALTIGLEHVARETEIYQSFAPYLIELKSALLSADLI